MTSSSENSDIHCGNHKVCDNRAHASLQEETACVISWWVGLQIDEGAEIIMRRRLVLLRGSTLDPLMAGGRAQPQGIDALSALIIGNTYAETDHAISNMLRRR